MTWALSPEPSADPEVPMWGQDTRTHSQVGKMSPEDVSASWDPCPGSRWLFCRLGMPTPSLAFPVTDSPQGPATKLCNNYIL